MHIIYFTLVKKTEHIQIRTVFVIAPQDTTQNSVFDEGKLPMWVLYTF